MRAGPPDGCGPDGLACRVLQVPWLRRPGGPLQNASMTAFPTLAPDAALFQRRHAAGRAAA